MPLVNLDGEKGQEYFADGLTEELTTELARYQDIRVIASQSTMTFKNREIDPGTIGKDLGVRYLKMKLNPYYPTCFHLATFMNHFRKAEYDKAYNEASKFNFPTLFWDPVMRATALIQLGRRDEAAAAVQQLIELENDFTTQGQNMVSR
jgi:hypothetical protein